MFFPSTLIRTAMPMMVALSFFSQTATAVIRDGGVDPANLGNGDWIYYTGAVTSGLGGNVPSVTSIASYMACAKSQGIRYIIVKAATGTNSSKVRQTRRKLFIARANNLAQFSSNFFSIL